MRKTQAPCYAQCPVSVAHTHEQASTGHFVQPLLVKSGGLMMCSGKSRKPYVVPLVPGKAPSTSSLASVG